MLGYTDGEFQTVSFPEITHEDYCEANLAAATEKLKSYSWPGNVRELQNVIERVLILSHSPILELDADLAFLSTPEVLADSPSEGNQAFRPPHIVASTKAKYFYH